MRAALIPPRGLEGYILRSTFQLALAIPDCMENRNYVRTYQEAADRGDYIVLDNGVADGGLVNNEDLLKAADKLGADELVAPDVLYDKVRTVVKVKKFLQYLQLQDYKPGRFKIMGVAQGTSPSSIKSCLEVYSCIPEITTVGLPKHMLTTLNHLAARIDMANWIEAQYPGRFEIHLLGTNPVWLKEVAAANKYAPHIRSVDSALAFNYALASQNLATTKIVLTRNPEYFSLDWSSTVSTDRLNSNIKTFLEWSNGITETSPSGELRSVSLI